ncbi:UbiA family prenyltransferase, partial [Streptomyces sp. NPDC005408]|uniref:UbiA family prenyltransferase n=1 Tax=Streptomyces sp. NPDC005408 TaxID=3155341 RepID=UPI0033B3A165
LCLYEAGMALNDWADREVDAVERPHRPIPSGRVSASGAFAAAGALTAMGLGLAALAGRPALVVATALSGAVWSYDLYFKQTAGGPAAMAAARGLDLVLGAVATGSAPARRAAGVGSADHGTGRAGGCFVGVGSGDRVAGRAGLGLARVGDWRGAGAVGVGSAGRGAGRAGLGLVGVGSGDRVAGRAGLGLARVGSWRGAGAVGVGSAGRGAGRAGLGIARVADRGPSGVFAALPSAGVLAAHTYAVTAVSRREAQGGSTAVPLAALAATIGLGAVASRASGGGGVPAPRSVRAGRRGLPVTPFTSRGSGGLPPASGRGGIGETPTQSPRPPAPAFALTPARLATTALAVAYIRTAAKPLLHAALNPSPPLTQRAVGGGIRAMIPLQATLAARAGGSAGALATAALAPLARTLARKVSVT